MPYQPGSPTHSPKKKEAKNFGLQPRKTLAEVHGNRTHLSPSAEGTPDLKDKCPGQKAPQTCMVEVPAFHDIGYFNIVFSKTYSPTYSPDRPVKNFS